MTLTDEEKKEKKEPGADIDDDHGAHVSDAQEVKEILGVVSTEIPKLLDAVSRTLYNPENAESFGKSVAQFYKQMRDAGMDEKQAYDMTQKFMANFSMGSMLSNMLGGAIKEGVKADRDDEKDDD